MNKQLVVKSNKLNEARYKLSVQEQRILLTMVSMIKPEDVDFKAYRFTIKEFAELVGLSGESVYSEVKKITATLVNKGFTIKEPDGDLQIGWVSSAKYYDKKAYVELCFDPKLKPYLLSLKKEFTRYQLKNTIKLKSAYSVRIYELLKQYQSIGYREFELQELRSVLGIPAGSLEPYANFRMKVLDVAHKELTMADISFDYTPLKTGRRVTGIRFDIKPNMDAIKQSKKKKPEKKETVPNSGYFNALDSYFNGTSEQAQSKEKEKEEERLNMLVKQLKQYYPDKYRQLNRQSKKLVGKKKHGKKAFIRFKMQELVEDFIKKENIPMG